MNVPLDRSIYLQVLQAALFVRHYRYAGQAALAWLSVYPGDLAVSLAYARALQGENRLDQAAAVLAGLCRADPEYLEAVEALLAVEQQAGGDGAVPSMLRYALTGRAGGSEDGGAVSRGVLRTAGWGALVWQARQALAQPLPRADRPLSEQQGAIERQLDQLLHAGGDYLAGPVQALLALTHLQYLEAGAAPGRRLEIAQRYAQRWPDCLGLSLRLAAWRMQAGQHAEAVALLHQAAARDVGGQVAQRLWGGQHPYRPLWPDHLALRLPGSPPAAVAAALGWNRLAAGSHAPHGSGEMLPRLWDLTLPPAAAASLASQPAPEELAAPEERAAPKNPPAPQNLAAGSAALQQAGPLRDRLAASEPPAAFNPPLKSTLSFEPDPPLDDELQGVKQVLDKTARRYRLPGAASLDGRYPVYVIFSLRQRLAALYGAQAAALVESEMTALAEQVGRLPQWGARVVLADDPPGLQSLGLATVRSGDPWELKLFLADLDAALRRTGERVGALLIVGGPEIVPFHHLPNPVDDQDVDVPSDTPYATRDENYFVPEWPVGRLPGGAGSDAHLLLAQLQNIRRSHEQSRQALPWTQRLRDGLSRSWSWFCRKLGRAGPQPSFGYTAAVWRQAAAMVFAPIGRGRRLHVSPPYGLEAAPNGLPVGALAEPGDEPAGLSGRVPEPYGRLGYFNLHGLVDAPEWYGQRDPLDDSDAPDYPVALRPQDIGVGEASQHSQVANVPRVVFSEACYGLHIQDRTPEQAIALRFLQAGSLAIAGSTVMAYGAIGTPLVAADLLGYTFWRLLQEGRTAGEALCRAKIHLATVMSHRQGYLDGEDQKTLISFILYGDPLAQVGGSGRHAKSLRYQDGPRAELRTVCERSLPAEESASLPPEVLAGVRRTVTRYLPGMSDARVTYAHARDHCGGEGHACPTSQMEHRPQTGGLPRPSLPLKRSSGRLPGLVTLSKQVRRAEGVHPRIARLTLDERGKLMKLVVSR